MDSNKEVFFKSFTDSKDKRLEQLRTGRLSYCEFLVFLVGEENENNNLHKSNTSANNATKTTTSDENINILIAENMKNCKISETKLFRCHQMILALSSEVFERMFFGEFDKQPSPILISDISPEVFEIFLNYIYTYDLDLNQVTLNNIAQLLYVAEKYMVNDFGVKCVNAIKDKPWKLCDILPTFELSCFYGDMNLMLMSYEKICENGAALINHETFFKLNLNNMKRLMILLTQFKEIAPTLLFDALKKYGVANKIFNHPFKKDYNELLEAAYQLELDKTKCKTEFFLLVPNCRLDGGDIL